MKKAIFYLIILLSWSSGAHRIIAQNAYPEKYRRSIELFVKGYNSLDYSTVKKSFSPLAKVFATKKMIMGQYLEPRFSKYGKLIRLGKPSYAAENVLLFPLIYEKDSSEIEYLALTFTKKNKIISLYFSADNIIYPKLTDSLTIDSLVKPYLSFKHHANTGLIIGLYDKGKRSIYRYGETEKGSGTIPAYSTLFQIGSITKVFTGILFANSINNHIVDSLSLLSGFLPDSIPKLSYKGKEIGLLHLATHTSALPREPDNLGSTVTDERNPFASYHENDLMMYLKNEKLKREIGKEYEYSNTGVGLLGYVLSKQRKMTYEELLIREICNKLNMNDTRTVLNEDQKKRRVKSYSQGKETPDFSFDSPFTGAGAIYSSVGDMFKFIEANLYPEKTSIQKDLVLAQQAHKIDKYLSMGLAWDISTVTNHKETVTVIGHSGNTMGTSSFIILSKEKKLAVVVFANSNVPVDDIGLLAFKIILNRQK
ncbi:MAG: beta-lactamase [Bacteroidetes bacterium]|jgi:CubicO group peptidase (beta-lactamase class C family)|nr:beta-lactamase [Bacteroidota bacterium]